MALEEHAHDTIEIRPADEEDVERLVELADDFFSESELPTFADFAPDHLRRVLREAMHSPAHRIIVLEDDAGVQAALGFTLDCSYTRKPMALMWFFYVAPMYRRGPTGRILLEAAEAVAQADGATVFYAGAMSGIPSVRRTLPNMYRKAGYADLPFWGRKLLGAEGNA